MRSYRMPCCWTEARWTFDRDVYICGRCGYTIPGAAYHSWLGALKAMGRRNPGLVLGPAPGRMRALQNQIRAMRRIQHIAQYRPRR